MWLASTISQQFITNYQVFIVELDILFLHLQIVALQATKPPSQKIYVLEIEQVEAASPQTFRVHFSKKLSQY